MSTAVSGSTLNLSASSVMANSDASRNAANATLKLSFSDLLRGQAQSRFNTRASEIPSLTDTRFASTRTPPEASREPSRIPGDSFSSPASRPQASRPSQESARANDQNSPSQAGQATKRTTETQKNTAPPQQTTIKSEEPTQSTEKEKIPGNTPPIKHAPQPQPSDDTISPISPAMIAVSSHEIAGETANDASENDSTTEASPRNARANTSHSRHPGTVSNLFARAATSTDSAIQSGEDMESNADGHRNDNGQGTNPNLSAALTGRASRHLGSTDSIAPTPQNQTTALSGTGNESPAQIGAVARDMVTNAVNVAAMSSREGSGTRTAPTGITINTGDVSMLNPPRLPTQSGAVLPPFTIPAGAGQRAWAEEIGNRVMWILGRAENRAELILTPPHLGKVEVSIHLNGDQGTAQFLASSQSAREALEQAMPRLRELLAQAGISLGETHVNTSAEGRAQDGENTSRMGMRASDIRDDDGDGNATAIVTTNEPRLNNGLVDVFA